MRLSHRKGGLIMTEKPIKKAELEARRKAEGETGDSDRGERGDRRERRGKKGDRRKGRDNGGKEKANAVPLALVRGPKPSAKPKAEEVEPEAEAAVTEETEAETGETAEEAPEASSAEA
ncbi:MAG: hypothetical protein ACO4AI_02875 [Prochlorothrix sp.]|nr:hypothetical protein [Prochlorothrix sp.]